MATRLAELIWQELKRQGCICSGASDEGIKVIDQTVPLEAALQLAEIISNPGGFVAIATPDGKDASSLARDLARQFREPRLVRAAAKGGGA